MLFMKTAEELFKEISASKDLQNELSSIGKGQFSEVEAFLKKHDCAASAKEFSEYVKLQKEGEISDEDAGSAAGGGWMDWIKY